MKQSNDEESVDKSYPHSITRRSAIRKSTFLTGTALTGASATIFGTGAASASCSDETGGNLDSVTYYDDWGDKKTARDVDCSNVNEPNKRDRHGMSVLYRGSTMGGGDINHHFTMTGHTEHHEQERGLDQCNKDWVNTYGVGGHRVTIESHRNATWWDKPSGGSVAGYPEDSSGSNVDLTARDAAFTALSTAAGYAGGPWVGAASSIILSMVPESQGDDNFDSYDEMMFDWDYANFNGPKCGSHTVDWAVQNSDQSDETVSMDVTDEAWGEYPNYTKIQKQINFTDATIMSSQSDRSLSPSSELWRQTGHPAPPEKGDVIETSRGEPARVTSVDIKASVSSSTAPKKTKKGKNLPNGLSAYYDDDEKVDVWSKTGLVREISISAKLLEK